MSWAVFYRSRDENGTEVVKLATVEAESVSVGEQLVSFYAPEHEDQNPANHRSIVVAAFSIAHLVFYRRV